MLLGLVFLASAYLKLFPIEAFEFNFVSIGVANWSTAPLMARLLIGAEFALGVFLIFNIALQRVTLPAVLAMLAVFTVYLVYQLFTEGNEGNCGCFGTYLEMTPLESIAKNVMMAGIAVWLLITKKQWTFSGLPKFMSDVYVAPVLGLIMFALPFVLNPVGATVPDSVQGSGFVGKKLDLERLYSADSLSKPTVDLRVGKHVLALFSMRCEHCKMASLKMNVMHRRHPELPFYYVLRGKAETRLQPFLTETQYSDVPYTVYNDDYFFELSGGAVPAIYRLENGLVVKAESVYTLNEDELVKWYNEK